MSDTNVVALIDQSGKLVIDQNGKAVVGQQNNSSGCTCCNSSCCCVAGWQATWNCSSLAWDVAPAYIFYDQSLTYHTGGVMCAGPYPFHDGANVAPLGIGGSQAPSFNQSTDACNTSSGFWNTWFGVNSTGDGGCSAYYYSLYNKSGGTCGTAPSPSPSTPSWTPSSDDRCCDSSCPCGADCPACCVYENGDETESIRCCYTSNATMLVNATVTVKDAAGQPFTTTLTDVIFSNNSANYGNGCIFVATSGTCTISGSSSDGFNGTYPVQAASPGDDCNLPFEGNGPPYYVVGTLERYFNSLNPASGPLSWDLDMREAGEFRDVPGDCSGPNISNYDDPDTSPPGGEYSGLTISSVLSGNGNCSDEDYYPAP